MLFKTFKLRTVTEDVSILLAILYLIVALVASMRVSILNKTLQAFSADGVDE